MLYNYFIIAFRNLNRHKVFSSINILGLAIGITCCTLLALFIKDEFSYERHFQDYNRIYRVTTTIISDQLNGKIQRTSPPIAMTMLRDFPELESATRLVEMPNVDQHLIQHGDKTFYEKKGYLVDSTFFEIFSYAFEEGDRNTALDGPSAVVLSHNVARKIFNDQSALDKLIIINSGNSSDTFRVTGVLKPYTHKSQLDANIYMCMNSQGIGRYVNAATTWSGQNFVYAFIKLKPATSADNLEAKFPALLEKYAAKELNEIGFQKILQMQPLSKIHLYSFKEFNHSQFGFMEIGESGNITYVYIIASICVFILLIACINFMNLTTAKAMRRAGEVGVRKSLGASRTNLIRQFLGESMVIVLFAMILSAVFVQASLPLFNQFTQKELSINYQNVWYITAALTGISVITALIAGSYPAFFLSAFQPAKVLKEKHLSGNSSSWLRKSLVVFQFVISITLISSIFIIHQQMRFIQNKSLGFNPEYKITLPLRTVEAKSAYRRLKDRFQELSFVRTVTASSSLPASPIMNDLLLYPDGSTADKAHDHFMVNIDEDYLELLDIKLLSGRNLRFETDTFRFFNATGHILVNAASLKATGLKMDEVLGSRLNADLQGRRMAFTVEGIVEDFHQASMRQSVSPMMFVIPVSSFDYAEIALAVDARDYDDVVSQIQQVWKEIVQNTPFEYAFLSDNVRRQYDADQRVFSLISVFTIIAIVISCLGLYGLSIDVSERRVKEIGIRKVLGASVSGIVGMLSKDFIKLVAIAFALAIPLGYYGMTRWLENFAYKIEVGVLVFVVAGLVSFAIAWIIIGFHSVKAALRNPADALKTE
ncbi:MAG: ABC transporter permease [Cyclobacteriaceae bacterium]